MAVAVEQDADAVGADARGDRRRRVVVDVRIVVEGVADALAALARLVGAQAVRKSLEPAAAEFLPIAYDAAPDECLFYDLIYARRPTPFLKPAAALGRRTFDGAGMLANQGALAFELFNRVASPEGLMRATLMAALGRS